MSDIYFYLCVCVYVCLSPCVSAHGSVCLERPEEGAGFPGARVPCCEPPDVSAGNWAWVFSARAAPPFQSLNCLSSPVVSSSFMKAVSPAVRWAFVREMCVSMLSATECLQVSLGVLCK